MLLLFSSVNLRTLSSLVPVITSQSLIKEQLRRRRTVDPKRRIAPGRPEQANCYP